MTPRLGSHGTEGGRQREQLPETAADNEKEALGDQPNSEMLTVAGVVLHYSLVSWTSRTGRLGLARRTTVPPTLPIPW